MMINALNSGARVFMADLEDALSPDLGERRRRPGRARATPSGATLALRQPEGKAYRLNDEIATLVVRPRGWHLDERHCSSTACRSRPRLFDFGLYLFHNGAERVRRGTGPYFYLPKLESHRRGARSGTRSSSAAQDALGMPGGAIRATVLIETILAAFEMDEILYELREHAAG